MTRKALLQSVVAAVAGTGISQREPAKASVVPYKCGDLLSLELPYAISQEARRRLEAYLEPIAARHGVTILILEEGATLRNPRKCPACDGWGERPQAQSAYCGGPPQYVSGGTDADRRVPCPACGGKGVMSES